jgi:hypothetical protein
MVHKISSRRNEMLKIELPQAIDCFLTAMTLEGKSPYTIWWHRKKLPGFSKFLQQRGHSLNVSELAVDDAHVHQVFDGSHHAKVTQTKISSRA